MSSYFVDTVNRENKFKDSHATMVKKSYTNEGLFTRREGYPCAVENALNSRNKGKILSS